MKKRVSTNSPGQLTVLAAMLAGLCTPALAGSDIVISQVYGGGGNSGSTLRSDFIELFNRGSTTLPIGGWSVQYASAAGNSWQVTSIPNGVSLAPGQYYLIKEKAEGGGTVDVPFDIMGTGIGIAMSATTGKVALVSSTTALNTATPSGGALVDLVGFGGAGAFEGSLGPAPAPSAVNAVFRKDFGCTDDNVNKTDFQAATAAPRTSTSALHACNAPPAIIATCPATLSVQQGSGGSSALSAIDLDGIVNNAVITSTAVPGISLTAFLASSAANANATVNLDVGAAAAAGTYPVVVNFSNDQGQSTACTVNVTVQGPAGAVTFRIPEIQGSGATSPHLGVQTTEGVITLKLAGSGFFMQDRLGDNDPTTSDGIFVFGASTNYLVGDLVRVTGTVVEYTPANANRSYTELKDTTAITKVASVTPIAPTNITMPTDLSKVEGMLVRFTNPLIVNATDSLGDRGEVTLASKRREVPTNRYPAGTSGALQMAVDNAADQIVLDDGSFDPVVTTIPYVAADDTVRVGDTVNDLVGVVDYGSIGNSKAGFKLQPMSVASVSIARTNARTAGPLLPVGNVRVASANVLNFFTTFTNGTDTSGVGSNHGCTVGTSTNAGNCRGADSMAEFVRQRTKIVEEIKAIDADVVGLMEIQNNGNVAVDHLVASLNAAIGSNAYAAVPVPSFTGTDAIRVAMIYKPAIVSAVGAPIADPDEDINNRAPLAQTFKAGNGAKFSVIVNHLKSKSCGSASGGNRDQNDGQGCWNVDRKLQADRLKTTFIPQVITASGDPDVLIIGDFNSHGFEDPINLLTANGGMVNELERFVRPNGIVYSYVFDGEAGYLDHALATPSLDAQVAGATEWHNNADEPEVIDYNFNLGTAKTAKPKDLYAANAYRASDHDPVVISLNLAPSYLNVTSSFTVQRSGYTQNRATGQYTGTYSFTNKTGAAINGPFQLELAGLAGGVTLVNATGSHNGAPYITVGNASIAPGATISVSTTFTNPAKVAISYTATIYSGTF